MNFANLRRAVEEVELIDAHSIVELNSNFAFIHAFSEAHGDAVSFAPHSISFKRSLREIAELYGSQCSLPSVEEYRRVSGLQSICSTCFKAAKISAILIDDGLELDKKHDFRWHESLTPLVGRILRVERLAEKILDEALPDGSQWILDNIFVTVAGEIFGLKSIAAYRSGLEINTKVTKKDTEEGLTDVLTAGKPVRITNKNLIDYIFLRSLEVAQSYDLPMQIHTGFGDTDMDITDGYAFPETFYLGAKKSSEVVFSVLRDACIDGDLSGLEAVEAAKDIFARNRLNYHWFVSCGSIFLDSIDAVYQRLQPNTWSGAFKCWGNENKEAPLRAASTPGIPNGLVSNFEIKSFDATANPHLGLAAIIAAGIDELRRHLTLPEPVDTEPGNYPENFRDDDTFKEFMGEKLLTAIKAVRKADSDYYSQHEDAYKNLIHIY
ncbi:hypothetical protein K1719_031771 [Acacia pycnantha]|nr:hypothetical protein K1719_031771 [Acacia pycnantha]